MTINVRERSLEESLKYFLLDNPFAKSGRLREELRGDLHSLRDYEEALAGANLALLQLLNKSGTARIGNESLIVEDVSVDTGDLIRWTNYGPFAGDSVTKETSDFFSGRRSVGIRAVRTTIQRFIRFLEQNKETLDKKIGETQIELAQIYFGADVNIYNEAVREFNAEWDGIKVVSYVEDVPTKELFKGEVVNPYAGPPGTHEFAFLQMDIESTTSRKFETKVYVALPIPVIINTAIPHYKTNTYKLLVVEEGKEEVGAFNPATYEEAIKGSDISDPFLVDLMGLNFEDSGNKDVLRLHVDKDKKQIGPQLVMYCGDWDCYARNINRLQNLFTRTN